MKVMPAAAAAAIAFTPFTLAFGGVAQAGPRCSSQMAQVSPSIYAQCLLAEQNQNACGRAAGCDGANDGGAYVPGKAGYGDQPPPAQGPPPQDPCPSGVAVAPDGSCPPPVQIAGLPPVMQGTIDPVTGKYIPPAPGMVEPLPKPPPPVPGAPRDIWDTPGYAG